MNSDGYKPDGYHWDGGHLDYETVLASAIRREEQMMYIMLDPKTNRYHEIRPCGYDHWKKHYREVAVVERVPEVTRLDGK